MAAKKRRAKKARKGGISHSKAVRRAKKAARTRKRNAAKGTTKRTAKGKRRSRKGKRRVSASRIAKMQAGLKKYRRRVKRLSPSRLASHKAKISAKRRATRARRAARKVKPNRRYGLRRNAGSFLATLKPYLMLGAKAIGGFAAHRLGTKVVTSLVSGMLGEQYGSVASALAVAAAGVYASKRFLPSHSAGIIPGLLVSAGSIVVKNLLPDFANTLGLGGLETVSIGPRYGAGSFQQAMAGNFQQAAAGEYFSGTGEYMSSDMFGTGSMGEYEMRQLDVLGDTGSYELSQTYGTGNVPTYDGVRPENADTFLEAMAGVQDTSTYIPHEPSGPAGGAESSFSAGIFDAGNVLAG